MTPKDIGQSDEDVVKKSLVDKDVFGLLIFRYAEKLGRYIRRLGVSHSDDREDLLQTIFLKVYQNLNSFDKRLSFSTWIYRITHNETVSFFRKKSVRPENFLIENSEEFIALLSEEGDTIREIELTYDVGLLKNALVTLDQKYREVLILRYIEDREYVEISDILQIPSASVGTLIHRAKKILKEKLTMILKI